MISVNDECLIFVDELFDGVSVFDARERGWLLVALYLRSSGLTYDESVRGGSGECISACFAARDCVGLRSRTCSYCGCRQSNQEQIQWRSRYSVV